MFQRSSREQHDEEESIFVSMTDLSVSMLLLLVILLGFFASQYRQANLIEQEEVRAKEVQDLQAEIVRLEDRLTLADPDGRIRMTLQNQLGAREAEISSLQGRFAAAQSDLAEMQIALAAERYDFDRLRGRLLSELDLAATRLTGLDLTLTKMQAANEAERKLREAQAMRDALRLQEGEARRLAQANEILHLQSDLALVSAMAVSLEQQMSQRLTAQAAEHDAKSKEAAARIASLESALTEAMDEAAALRKDAEIRQADVQSRESIRFSEVATNESRLEALANENETLRAQISSLESLLASVMNSASSLLGDQNRRTGHAAPNEEN